MIIIPKILVIKHEFDNMENHNPKVDTIVGYLDTQEELEEFLKLNKVENPYRGWDGKDYPFYTSQEIINLN